MARNVVSSIGVVGLLAAGAVALTATPALASTGTHGSTSVSSHHSHVAPARTRVTLGPAVAYVRSGSKITRIR